MVWLQMFLWHTLTISSLLTQTTSRCRNENAISCPTEREQSWAWWCRSVKQQSGIWGRRINCQAFNISLDKSIKHHLKKQNKHQQNNRRRVKENKTAEWFRVHVIKILYLEIWKWYYKCRGCSSVVRCSPTHTHSLQHWTKLRMERHVWSPRKEKKDNDTWGVGGTWSWYQIWETEEGGWRGQCYPWLHMEFQNRLYYMRLSK